MDELAIVPHAPAPPVFDKEAYRQYKLALKFGEAVSGWDDPEMVTAPSADHMRADDYVIGLVFNGSARAYPLWVVDNYHVVNDTVGDERFFLASCERCQSGAAFVAEVAGNPERAPVFRSVGFLNATLLLKDLRSGSHWIHYEGVGLDRKAAGLRLPWIPTLHLEWADWVALHPDTLVMVPPQDPTHPDARHGHGREELFARAGMDPGFIATIVGPLDNSYPENEMVLGITGADGSSAYPLREVQREGGVVNTHDSRRPITILAGPRDDDFTMAAYDRQVAGFTLTLSRDGETFVDAETGSTWTIEGRAISGALQGQSLTPVPWYYVRWHAWIYFHRETNLFISDKERTRLAAGSVLPAATELAPAITALAETGHELRLGEPLISQRRPREAIASTTIYVDGDRVNMHLFATEGAARDFDTFAAAWSGFPIKPKSHDAKTRRVGRLVVESDPEERYVDPAQVVPLPPSVVAWAKALQSSALDDIAYLFQGPSDKEDRPRFLDVVRALRLDGHEVLDIAFLPPSQLRVGATNGIALTIDAERFLLYRFSEHAQAAAYAATEAHAVAVGPIVLRSTPETMYMHQAAEVLYAGDEWIRWSSLVEDPRLVTLLARAGAHAGNKESSTQ